MRMKKPPHPGRIVRQECIEPLGLTVTEAAQRLGVTRQALNNLVNEKAGISPEMAIRLSKAFGSSPEVWLGLQVEYDLVLAGREARRINVRRITSPLAARTSKIYVYPNRYPLSQDKKKKAKINADDKPKAVFGEKKTASIRDN